MKIFSLFSFDFLIFEFFENHRNLGKKLKKVKKNKKCLPKNLKVLGFRDSFENQKKHRKNSKIILKTH